MNNPFRWVFANPDKLAAHCMKSARELYPMIACDKSMIREGMLARIIEALVPFWSTKVGPTPQFNPLILICHFCFRLARI